jgi:DNA-directed RNA polymerase specialized sigma24 family protein
MAVVDRIAVDSFTEFVRGVEPKLRVALCLAFGREAGLDAASYALAYGWEHWDRVSRLANPAGYLWGVGRNHARRIRSRRAPAFGEVEIAEADALTWFEPGLPVALSRLTDRQRAAVLLIHGLGWTHREVAGLLGITVPTVQKHAQRGLVRLRREMGVE